jgi:HNH endonuclease/AP2 domain
MKLLSLVNCADMAIIDDEDYDLCQPHRWRRLSSGYVYAPEETFLYLHRLILGASADGLEVDHINGNRLDNRRVNLRPATHHVNQVNRHHRNRRNKSGIRGVNWDKRERKWAAHICVHRKHIGLGTFHTIEEATLARQYAELKYYGELCPLPDCEFKEWGGMGC